MRPLQPWRRRHLICNSLKQLNTIFCLLRAEFKDHLGAQVGNGRVSTWEPAATDHNSPCISATRRMPAGELSPT
jgi:hypothetical protein